MYHIYINGACTVFETWRTSRGTWVVWGISLLARWWSSCIVATVLEAGKSQYIRSYTVMYRVDQNHLYTVHIRYFWQGNYKIYGHIRYMVCVYIYMVLANLMYIHGSGLWPTLVMPHAFLICFIIPGVRLDAFFLHLHAHKPLPLLVCKHLVGRVCVFVCVCVCVCVSKHLVGRACV